jgi:beta-glucanase (GH16 family)
MLSNSLSSSLKLSLSCLFVLTGWILSAQQSSLDFSSDFHEFVSFNGANFTRNVDPLDNTNTAGKITNNGDVWEGAYIQLPEAAYLESVKTITLRYYSASTDTNTILMKLEDNLNLDVEIDQAVSSVGWTTLTFDFSQAREAGTSNIVSANGSYEKMVIFFNGGSSKTGTFYMDDITYANYESTNQLDVVYTNLVYADEFSQFGPVDTSNWFPEVVPPNAWGWFNGEEQHYTSRTDNVYSSNGTLKIIAKRENYTAYGQTKSYTSARLNSKFSFTYGRIDVRAKMPEGDGTWPAIWMLGTSIGNNWNSTTIGWPDCGEIDIMEHWGNDPNVVHGSTHTRSSHGATFNTEEVKREKVSEGFHVYSVNWSPNQISFLMDGFLYYTYNPSIKNAITWPFDAPQFVLLNVAMGGIYSIDPSFTESTMEVDYVRVYQNNIGLEEKPEVLNATVYPNPAVDYIEVETETDGVLNVYDVTGKLVLTESLDSESGNHISVSELSNGVYIWNITSGNSSRKGKLIITNR